MAEALTRGEPRRGTRDIEPASPAEELCSQVDSAQARGEPAIAKSSAGSRWHRFGRKLLREPRWVILLLIASLSGSLAFQIWSDPQRYFEAGMAGVREGNLEKVQRSAAALQSVPAYRHQHAYLAAWLLMRSGQHDQALRLAVSSQDHPDVEIEARVLAGEIAYRLGAAGNAKLLWEDALVRDAECVAAHQWLGVLYFDLGAMDNAILHLQAVSQLSPKDHRPDRLMGLINRDYERPEIAIPHYQESLRRAPHQPEADTVWMELAECQIKLREFEAALESLQRRADSARKHRLTARCLLNLGSLEDARRLARQALRAEPDDVKNLQLGSEIALADGQVDLAAQLLRKAAQVDPFDHGVRSQLAQILGRLGLDAEANKHSERAEELQALWQRFSDLQIDAINRMNDANVRYEIGTLARQLGKPELATGWFKAALAIDPRMSIAAEALAESD